MSDFHNVVVEYEDFMTFPCREDFVDKDLQQNINADIKNNKPIYFLTNDIKESAPFLPYHLYLSGILLNGSKAVIKILHIRPYVDLNFDNIELSINSFGTYVNKIKKIIQDYNNDETVEYKNKIRDYNFQKIKGKKLIGYQKDEELFIRVTFLTKQDRKKFIDLMKIVTTYNINLFNNDTSSYYRSISREYEINLASWNKITQYSKTSEKFKSEYKFECSIDDIKGVYNVPDKLYINQIEYNNSFIKKDKSISCCFDIEAYSPIKGRVPDGTNPSDDLFMICMTFQFVNENKSCLNVCIVDKPCEPQEELYTVVCKNEREVLMIFSKIVGNMQPDFISEFNGSSYDWKVIKEKLVYHKLYIDFKKNMSLDEVSAYDCKDDVIFKYNFSLVQIKIGADKMIQMFGFYLFGYVSFDSKIILERLFPNLENFKLNTFLKVNNLTLKDDLPISEMFKIYENNDKHGMKKVAHYCYIDSFSIHELLFKKNVIQDKREIASISYTSLADSFYRADAMRVANLVVHKCIKSGLLYSETYNKPEKGCKFPGALVLEPKKGLVNVIMSIKDYVIHNKIEELYDYHEELFKIISVLFQNIYKDYDLGGISTISHNVNNTNTNTNTIGINIDIEYNSTNGVDYFTIDNFFEKTVSKNNISQLVNILDHMRLTINEYVQYVCHEKLKYPVCALDFASLYPSIIMTYNISPEYWIKDEEHKNRLENDENDNNKYKLHHIKFMYGLTNQEREINSWTIRQINEDKQFGLYPQTLKELFDVRSNLKKILKPLEHRIEELNNLKEDKYKHITQEEYNELIFNFNYYNAKQLGVKVLMNTFYGVLGNTSSSLFILELAGGVTSAGQRNLLYVKSFLEKEKNTKTYYGDSVIGNTPIIIRIANKNKNANSYDYKIKIIQINELRYYLKDESYLQYRSTKEVICLTNDFNIDVYTEKGWTKIKKIIRHKSNKKLYRVTTKHGIVVVTEDHSLLDSNANKIEPKNCNIYTELLHWEIDNFNNDDNDVNENKHLNRFNKFIENYKSNISNIIKFTIPVCAQKAYIALLKYKPVVYIHNYTFYIILTNKELFNNNDYKHYIKNLQKFQLKTGINVNDLINDLQYEYNEYNEYNEHNEYLSYNDSVVDDDDNITNTNTNTNTNIETFDNKYYIKKIQCIGKCDTYVYDLETESHHFAAGIGQLVVHNTDSLYFSCDENNFAEDTELFYTGKINRNIYSINLINKSFEVIDILAHEVNQLLINDNGEKFLKMAYEEVLLPVVFVVKKQYYGLPHENVANLDVFDKDRKIFIRGLEVKKKGNSKVLINVYTSLMKESLDVNNTLSLYGLTEKYVEYMFTTKWDKSDFVKNKAYKPNKKNISINKFVDRMKLEGKPLPEPYERFRYVMVKKYPYTYDVHGKQTVLSVSDKMEYIEIVEKEDLDIDIMYYLNGELVTQFARLLTCLPEYFVYDEYTHEIDDTKTLNRCKKVIEGVADKFNNSYKNKDKIFKDLHKQVIKLSKNKYKNIDMILTLSEESKLLKLIEKEIKKINIQEVINILLEHQANKTEILCKYKKLFNSRPYSYYVKKFKELDSEIIDIKNKMLNTNNLNFKIDDVIFNIRNEYKFMDKCKDNNIEKLDDIITESEIQNIVNEKVEIDTSKYDDVNLKVQKLIELEIEKFLYKQIFEYINSKLNGTMYKHITYTKKTYTDVEEKKSKCDSDDDDE